MIKAWHDMWLPKRGSYYFIDASAEAQQFSLIKDPGTSGIVSVIFLLPFIFFMTLRIGFLWSLNPGGGGGGGTHNIFRWGCAARSWKPLPYFRPKYTIFHTLFQTWLSKCIPYFRPCDVWQIRQLSIDLGRTGLCDAPNNVRVLFLRDQCPRKHTLV